MKSFITSPTLGKSHASWTAHSFFFPSLWVRACNTVFFHFLQFNINILLPILFLFLVCLFVCLFVSYYNSFFIMTVSILISINSPVSIFARIATASFSIPTTLYPNFVSYNVLPAIFSFSTNKYNSS